MHANVPGGWTEVSNDDENLVSAANFAAGSDAKSIKVLRGSKQVFSYWKIAFIIPVLYACNLTQVVAGLLYDIIVQVVDESNKCSVRHYRVYDRFGKKSVVVSEDVDDRKCE